MAAVTCSPSVLFSTSVTEIVTTSTVLGTEFTRTITSTILIPTSTAFRTCSDESTETTTTSSTTTTTTTTDDETTTTTDSSTTTTTSSSTTVSSTSTTSTSTESSTSTSTTTSDTSTITAPPIATETVTSTTSSSSSTTTAVGIPNNSQNNNSSSFSTGAKIGVGVAGGIVAILVLGLFLRWLLSKKSRERDEEVLEKYRRESNIFAVDHGATNRYDPGDDGAPGLGGGSGEQAGYGGSGAATGAALGGAAAAYGASKRRSKVSMRDRRQDDEYQAYQNGAYHRQPAPVQFLGPGRPSPNDVLAQEDDDFYGGSQPSSQSHTYYDPRYPPPPNLAYYYSQGQQGSPNGTPPGGRSSAGYAQEGIPYAANQTRGQNEFIYAGGGGVGGAPGQQHAAGYIPTSLRPAQSSNSINGGRGNAPPPMPVPVPGAPHGDYIPQPTQQPRQQPQPQPQRGQTFHEGARPRNQQSRSSTMPPVTSTDSKIRGQAANDFEFPDFHRRTFHQGNIGDSLNRPLSQDRLDQPLPPPPKDSSPTILARPIQRRGTSEDDGGQSVVSVPNLGGRYDAGSVRGPLRITNQLSEEPYDGITH